MSCCGEFAKIFLKLIRKKGVINIGGKTQTIFEFAKMYNKNVKKIKSKGEMPFKMDMNLTKMRNLSKS